jgi:hypothetical protein
VLLNEAVHGRAIATVEQEPLSAEPFDAGRNTVAYEARYLKALFQKVIA